MKRRQSNGNRDDYKNLWYEYNKRAHIHFNFSIFCCIYINSIRFVWRFQVWIAIAANFCLFETTEEKKLGRANITRIDIQIFFRFNFQFFSCHLLLFLVWAGHWYVKGKVEWFWALSTIVCEQHFCLFEAFIFRARYSLHNLFESDLNKW